ncbi:MAG: flagellar filament capping protein FliD [Thermodesulfobacteriota bacterium]
MASDVSLTSSSPSYLSSSIKWSGLSSGIDFGEVVDQLIKIEQTHVTRLQTWRQTWVDKNTSLEGLNSRLVALKQVAQEMDSYSEFYVRQIASSNTTAVGVSGTGSAQVGTHTVVVGENIAGQLISRSFQDAVGVGAAGSGDWIITVGGQTLTLQEGVHWDSADTIEDLAAALDYWDDPTNGGQDILGEVYCVVDKVRDGTTYKRLVITAKNGGSANQISSTGGPSSVLGLNENTVDAVVEKTWLGSTSTPTSSGSYTGHTNKTFTFVATNTGVLGEDNVTFNWADNEDNSGSFTINALDWKDNPGMTFDVFQGVQVQFSAGRIIQAESFTVDVQTPVLRQAQDKGLAQAAQRVHTGFVDLITPVHSGATAEFTYRYEGVETTVQVYDGTTLEGLVDAINEDPNNRGVTASIVYDGQGGPNSYHLVLTGQDTGAAHKIELVTSAKPLSNFTVSEASFSETQRASDAMLKLDGFPSEAYKFIQRPTNTITDLITGLSLELKDAGQSVISVSNDADSVKTKIQGFVDSVNFVLDYIRTETKYDTETKESGIMLGNYSYGIIQTAIKDILFQSVPGLSAATDIYTHLAQIGLKTDPDQNGKLILDTTKLSSALQEDVEAVARLFVQDQDHGDSGSNGVAYRLQAKMVEFTNSENGIANVLMKNYNGIISDIDAKIASEERRIALVKTRYEEKFARLEMALSELNGQSQYLETQLSKLNNS